MKLPTLFTAATVLIISNSANAALFERLGGLAYYDDVANLTWLTDANAAAGRMDWDTAMNWATNLDVAGVTGWRLPDTLQPDPSCEFQYSFGSVGASCTGSEMGNLYYNVLGGGTSDALSETHNSNYELFSNIQDDFYWSATENPGFSNISWHFIMGTGTQHESEQFNQYFAWGVQTGDVSAVPVPATVWLFGSGLIGLASFSRRKKA